MREVKIYTRSGCGYCTMALELLEQLGIPYQEISLDGKSELRRKLVEETGGYSTVPMIFVDDRFIGGYTDLAALHSAGGLVKKAA